MENLEFSPQRTVMSFRRYLLNTVLPIICYGGIVGSLVGVIVWAYNFAAEKISETTLEIYTYVGQKLYFLPLLLLGLIALAFIVWVIIKIIPEIKGSGIPYTEGVMRGQIKYRTIHVFIGTILNSFISFFAGLPLGGEGPSVQVGGVIGQGVDQVFEKVDPRAKAFNRLAITGGASAGLAVAFNAPLTGIIFALEEGHKRFSPSIFLTSASSVLFATLISRLLRLATTGTFSGYFMFKMVDLESIPLNNLWMLLILGILIGLAAALFSKIQVVTKVLLDKFKIPTLARLIVAFVLVGIIGVFLTDILGGGSGLIKKIAALDFTWQMLLLLLVIKLFLIAICSNSGTTGGLFVPMLAIGALFGGLFGHLFMAMGMEEVYYRTMVIISMSAFMGGVVRAPLTAMVLIAEVTGSLMSGFFETGIVICLAYFTVELLDIQPLYDTLLEGTLYQLHKGQERKIVTFEINIEDGSFAAGRAIRDILWPSGCIVQKIVKMNKEGQIVSRMDKDGERLIYAGDVYIIQAETYNEEELREQLDCLVLNPKTVKIKKQKSGN